MDAVARPGLDKGLFSYGGGQLINLAMQFHMHAGDGSFSTGPHRKGPYNEKSPEQRSREANQDFAMAVTRTAEYNQMMYAETTDFLNEWDNLEELAAQDAQQIEQLNEEIHGHRVTISEADDQFQADTIDLSAAKEGFTDENGNRIHIFGEGNDVDFAIENKETGEFTEINQGDAENEAHPRYAEIRARYDSEIRPLEERTALLSAQAHATLDEAAQTREQRNDVSERLAERRAEMRQMLVEYGATEEEIAQLREDHRLLKEGEITAEEFIERVPENIRAKFEENNPEMVESFRARHGLDNSGPSANKPRTVSAIGGVEGKDPGQGISGAFQAASAGQTATPAAPVPGTPAPAIQPAGHAPG